MSRAALLAAAAAALAAAAAVELAAAAGETRPSGPRRRPALVAGLARLGARIGAPAPPAQLAARLDAAGAPGALRVADVMAVKAAAALLTLPLVLPLAAALPGRLGPLAGGVEPRHVPLQLGPRDAAAATHMDGMERAGLE